MISENDLWSKLSEFNLFKLGKDIPRNIINVHTKEFKYFLTSMNMSLTLYPIVLDTKHEDGSNDLDYYFFAI